MSKNKSKSVIRNEEKDDCNSSPKKNNIKEMNSILNNNYIESERSQGSIFTFKKLRKESNMEIEVENIINEETNDLNVNANLSQNKQLSNLSELKKSRSKHSIITKNTNNSSFHGYNNNYLNKFDDIEIKDINNQEYFSKEYLLNFAFVTKGDNSECCLNSNDLFLTIKNTFPCFKGSYKYDFVKLYLLSQVSEFYGFVFKAMFCHNNIDDSNKNNISNNNRDKSNIKRSHSKSIDRTLHDANFHRIMKFTYNSNSDTQEIANNNQLKQEKEITKDELCNKSIKQEDLEENIPDKIIKSYLLKYVSPSIDKFNTTTISSNTTSTLFTPYELYNYIEFLEECFLNEKSINTTKAKISETNLNKSSFKLETNGEMLSLNQKGLKQYKPVVSLEEFNLNFYYVSNEIIQMQLGKSEEQALKALKKFSESLPFYYEYEDLLYLKHLCVNLERQEIIKLLSRNYSFNISSINIEILDYFISRGLISNEPRDNGNLSINIESKINDFILRETKLAYLKLKKYYQANENDNINDNINGGNDKKNNNNPSINSYSTYNSNFIINEELRVLKNNILLHYNKSPEFNMKLYNSHYYIVELLKKKDHFTDFDNNSFWNNSSYFSSSEVTVIYFFKKSIIDEISNKNIEINSIKSNSGKNKSEINAANRIDSKASSKLKCNENEIAPSISKTCTKKSSRRKEIKVISSNNNSNKSNTKSSSRISKMNKISSLRNSVKVITSKQLQREKLKNEGKKVNKICNKIIITPSNKANNKNIINNSRGNNAKTNIRKSVSKQRLIHDYLVRSKLDNNNTINNCKSSNNIIISNNKIISNSNDNDTNQEVSNTTRLEKEVIQENKTQIYFLTLKKQDDEIKGNSNSTVNDENISKESVSKPTNNKIKDISKDIIINNSDAQVMTILENDKEKLKNNNSTTIRNNDPNEDIIMLNTDSPSKISTNSNSSLDTSINNNKIIENAITQKSKSVLLKNLDDDDYEYYRYYSLYDYKVTILKSLIKEYQYLKEYSGNANLNCTKKTSKINMLDILNLSLINSNANYDIENRNSKNRNTKNYTYISFNEQIDKLRAIVNEVSEDYNNISNKTKKINNHKKKINNNTVISNTEIANQILNSSTDNQKDSLRTIKEKCTNSNNPEYLKILELKIKIINAETEHIEKDLERIISQWSLKYLSQLKSLSLDIKQKKENQLISELKIIDSNIKEEIVQNLETFKFKNNHLNKKAFIEDLKSKLKLEFYDIEHNYNARITSTTSTSNNSSKKNIIKNVFFAVFDSYFAYNPNSNKNASSTNNVEELIQQSKLSLFEILGITKIEKLYFSRINHLSNTNSAIGKVAYKFSTINEYIEELRNNHLCIKEERMSNVDRIRNKLSERIKEVFN